MASLYVVSTPIGNLGDFTFRAVETLRSVDVVLAEDTRRTSILLRHHGISARLISAHEHNEAGRASLAVEILGEGRDVALVSDAGTPLLSDPGSRIVREVVAAGFEVVPIPGASALLAALVGSGIAADRFTFYGFIPRRGRSRTELLEEIGRSRYASVLYESPNRLAELVGDLAAAAGGDRRVSIARELTKMHEEFFRGTLEAASVRLEAVEARGEIVLVLEARAEATEEEVEADALAARATAAALLAQGLPPSGVARELRKRLGIARNAAYSLVHELAETLDPDPEG